MRRAASIDRHALHSVLFVGGSALIALASIAMSAGVAHAWTGASTGGTGTLLLVAAVLVLGLPHGALDAWTARRTGLWHDAGSGALFHALYLAAAGAVVVAFLVAPGVALLGFLVLSAHHFGGDWELPGPARWLPGTLVIVAPLAFHTGGTVALFALIGGEGFGGLAGNIGALPLVPLVLALAGMTLALDRRAGAEALAIVLLAATFGPLTYFALYFCGLHGIRHLLDHASNGLDVRVMAYALGGGAVVATTAFVLLASGAATAPAPDVASDFASDFASDLALHALFVGLAALTVPHAVLERIADRRA